MCVDWSRTRSNYFHLAEVHEANTSCAYPTDSRVTLATLLVPKSACETSWITQFLKSQFIHKKRRQPPVIPNTIFLSSCIEICSSCYSLCEALPNLILIQVTNGPFGYVANFDASIRRILFLLQSICVCVASSGLFTVLTFCSLRATLSPFPPPRTTTTTTSRSVITVVDEHRNFVYARFDSLSPTAPLLLSD